MCTVGTKLLGEDMHYSKSVNKGTLKVGGGGIDLVRTRTHWRNFRGSRLFLEGFTHLIII